MAEVSESWTGSDGAAWPAGWTLSGSSGYAATIQGNRGRLANSSSAFTYARAYWNGITAGTEQDLVVDIQPVTRLTFQSCFVALGASDTNGSTPAIGYSLEITYHANLNAGTCSWLLQRRNSGTNTQLGFGYISGVVSDNPYRLRFQRTGSVIRHKFWLASDSEPGSWMNSYTDASPLATPGKVHLAFYSDTASRSADFDTLTVQLGSANTSGFFGLF